MTEDQPEAEQPGVERRCCPSCASPLDESARYCPMGGRPVAPPTVSVDIRRWVKSGVVLCLRNPLSALSIAVVIIALVVVPVLAMLVPGLLLRQSVPRGDLYTIWQDAVRWAYFFIVVLVVPAVGAGACACFLAGIRTGALTAYRLGVGFRNWWACTWVLWVIRMACLMPGWLIWWASDSSSMAAISGAISMLLQLAGFTVIWPAEFRIVDRQCGGWDALEFAFTFLRGRFWKMLLFTFLMGLLVYAGLLAYWALSWIPAPAAIVGGSYGFPWMIYLVALVALPVALAAFAAGYDALTKRESAPQQ
jgi:hypothetical protein